MKKLLLVAVLALLVAFSGSMAYAQQTVEETTITTQQSSSVFDGRLKIQGYAEYLHFTGSNIKNGSWGGGILARYLFLDWLGAQTNATWYGDCKTDKLGGDLKFSTWRLSLILHTYAPDLMEGLYAYAGAGVGYQWSDDITPIKVDGAWTGNVIGAIGYDFTEYFNLEAEVGYQFGTADLEHFKRNDTGLEAIYVRLGGGVRF